MSSNPPATTKNLPPRRYWLVFVVVLIVNYIVARILFPGTEPITVPYTVFKQEVEKNNVSQVYSRGTSVEGRFKGAVTWPAPDEAKTPLRRGLPPPPRHARAIPSPPSCPLSSIPASRSS